MSVPEAGRGASADARGAWIAGLSAAILQLPFIGKAWHMDEPFYLAIARRILEDPWRPLAFSYNWYGETVPMSFLNNAPPLLAYLLAAALKVTGGGEALMRLLFLAFDAAAGAGLYLLAARFLRRPLWPTVVILACPAWLVNMNQLMTEKPAMALGLWGLYAWTRGVDEDDARWSGAGAALLSLAGFFKYAAVAFAAPALA